MFLCVAQLVGIQAWELRRKTDRAWWHMTVILADFGGKAGASSVQKPA